METIKDYYEDNKFAFATYLVSIADKKILIDMSKYFFINDNKEIHKDYYNQEIRQDIIKAIQLLEEEDIETFINKFDNLCISI